MKFEHPIVSNEQGLSVEVVLIDDISEHDYNDRVKIQLGGDDTNPSWEEYLNDYKDEFKPHVLLIRKFIEENRLIGISGNDTNDWNFNFSDGEIWGFSMRAWGDLMQSIVDKNEGYMAYYM